MNMKKSLIAAAVASVCAAPMAAQAEADVWAEFIAGFESLNDDASGNDDGTLQIALDSADFGFDTEEDLGNGLSVEAGTAIAVGGDIGDQVEFDETYGALSGDFGSVLLGWGVDSAFYLHVFAPVDAGIIYDTYQPQGNTGDDAENVVQYGYDAGAFQLTAEAVMDDSGDAADDSENFDRIGLGATFDAGPVSVGLGHQSFSEADDSAEPTSTGVSVGGEFGGFDLGVAYHTTDPDVDGAAEPSAIDVVGSTDFGGGLSGTLGLTSVDADTDSGDGDTTVVTANLAQSLSSRTAVFGELQSSSEDGGAADGSDLDERSIFVGVEHAF